MRFSGLRVVPSLHESECMCQSLRLRGPQFRAGPSSAFHAACPIGFLAITRETISAATVGVELSDGMGAPTGATKFQFDALRRLGFWVACHVRCSLGFWNRAGVVRARVESPDSNWNCLPARGLAACADNGDLFRLDLIASRCEVCACQGGGWRHGVRDDRIYARVTQRGQCGHGFFDVDLHGNDWVGKWSA
jgi:hypothetical protein